MYHVQKLCRHALWLKDGRVERYGDASSVVQAYLAYHEEKAGAQKQPIAPVHAAAAGFYAVQSLELAPGPDIAHGEDLVVSGEVFSPDGRPPVVLVGIVRADGTSVYGVATDMDGARAAARRGGQVRVLADAAAARAAARKICRSARMRWTRRACACSITSSGRCSSRAKRASMASFGSRTDGVKRARTGTGKLLRAETMDATLRPNGPNSGIDRRYARPAAARASAAPR